MNLMKKIQKNWLFQSTNRPESLRTSKNYSSTKEEKLIQDLKIDSIHAHQNKKVKSD